MAQSPGGAKDGCFGLPVDLAIVGRIAPLEAVPLWRTSVVSAAPAGPAFLWAEVDSFHGSGVLWGDAQDVDELFLSFLVAPQLQQ